MRQASSEILDAVWEVVTRRSFDRSDAATQLLAHILHSEGTISRRDDQLRAGDRVLNTDRELLPRMSQATGLGFCLYVGNRRIAISTVLDAGTAPELGAFANPELVDRVLRRREVFKGNIERNSREYIVVARPLFATGGEEFAPIGMVEAFQDKQAHFDLLASAARTGVEAEIAEVEQRADGMESIIHFIDDVARRLQLLALNGNIIAAQAGEHGRAFRVVCRELGVLADQAKHTGGDVRKLITIMGLDREIDGGFGSAFLADDEMGAAAPASADTAPTESSPE